ncbi:aspartic peptidase domain-containing protein [Crassisporium funariophilum]|nr:aspartic peptidase domain-containing protein [Crassisporium funariophilum]
MRCWLFLVALHAASQVPLTLASPTQTLTLDQIAQRYSKRTENGVHLPIVQRETPALGRRAPSTAIGLGDYLDVAYSVLITMGGITTPLILDTGSSDLWVMSDACSLGCTGNVRVYPQSSFKYSGLDVRMLYGDSRTGTFAQGMIGTDTVGLAGLKLQDQYFGAINVTNTSVIDVGAAGIFGLGFPLNSVIWNQVFVDKNNLDQTLVLAKREVNAPVVRPNVKWGPQFPKLHFRQSKTYHTTNLCFHLAYCLLVVAKYGSFAREAGFNQRTNASHIYYNSATEYHRCGGNVGMLSIGELPSGVSNESLTWVPLRYYTYDEGGLPGPPDAPNEVYPITWEVMLDDVYFDGQKLPRSTLSSPSINLSALVDTGNSLIRAPADLVELIQSRVGKLGHFPCSEPHTLAFSIGGKLFPVDPRDFVGQAFSNNVDVCYANLVATDPPRVGGYQFSWSLGTPFLKSVLTSYYYGNLSYPSRDPPRMGFLSTVPTDAGDRMKSAVVAAAKADSNFPAITQPAPSGSPTPATTNSNGIPQASVIKQPNAARGQPHISPGLVGTLSAILFATFALHLWT